MVLIGEADACIIIERFLFWVIARRLLSQRLRFCLIVIQAAPVTFEHIQTIVPDHGRSLKNNRGLNGRQKLV